MGRTTIIAETAQAHDGSLGMLHAYVDAAREAGVDAVKFQTHIAEAESSPHEPFRVKFSFQDETRYDYWKRMEFTAEQWRDIKKHCDEAGLEFISSPFSVAAVELLESLGVRRYKIASGEIDDYLMLERIARTGKPVLLSTGMSSFDEIAASVEFLRGFGTTDISILQCTTAYPVPPEKLGLNVLTELRRRFDLPVGLSDHSGTIFPCLAAVVLGASVLEIHLTFHKGMFGPDVMASVTPDELRQLVQGVRFIETALASPVRKDDTRAYESNRTIFGKSLAVNKDLRKGVLLSFADLESKKPLGHGIAAAEYQSVLGRRLTRDLTKYSFLTTEDIE
jgi:N,N'-diacetyllegionaminate synthase